MNNARVLAGIGAGLAFLAVAAGAFGTHGLQGRLPQDLLQIFETGVEYQMYHAIGLLLVGLLADRTGSRTALWAGKFFVVGTVIFSGSLYVLALTGFRWMGAITPIGGVCFLAGWAALAWGLIAQGRTAGPPADNDVNA